MIIVQHRIISIPRNYLKQMLALPKQIFSFLDYNGNSPNALYFLLTVSENLLHIICQLPHLKLTARIHNFFSRLVKINIKEKPKDVFINCNNTDRMIYGIVFEIKMLQCFLFASRRRHVKNEYRQLWDVKCVGTNKFTVYQNLKWIKIWLKFCFLRTLLGNGSNIVGEYIKSQKKVLWAWSILSRYVFCNSWNADVLCKRFL